MASTNPSKSFKNVCDAERVYQYYEKLKVENSRTLKEAIESFEILYKKGSAARTPSQLSKFRDVDVLVGESKIVTALSKLKGGVTCDPPGLVVTGMDVRARQDLAVRRLVHSDIVNNVVPRAGVMVCTEGSTGEMQATLRMSGVFTDEESSDKLMDLLRTATGILCNTEAFTAALKCINADKEVKRSIMMPLVDIPYEYVGIESAEAGLERLQREKEELQKLLDDALKAQVGPQAPKRSRAEADDPGAGNGREMAEQGRQAKAEADELLNYRANKKLIYERIDNCLAEYDSGDCSFASAMNWFKSGRTKVREMLTEQAAEAEREKAAKAEKKKADRLVVPETSDEEVESESEAEDSEEEPPPRGHVCRAVQWLCF